MGKRFIKDFSTLTLALCFLVGGVDLLHAQETASDEFTLEEITVTAQKREENQQKVPIAMDVISSDQIKELGENNLVDILDNVSNVIMNKSADGLRITLRGVSDTASTTHGQSVSAPTVAVNIDGVFSNRKDTGSGLYDLERVEVLYGPQSTMYSSNSPGGIVNVVSANPKLDQYEASGLLEYGNYNLLHTEGAMNAPITDKIALRAAFTTSIRDGYLSNGGDSEDTKSARIKGLFQATDKLSFILTGEVSKEATHRNGAAKLFISQDGYYYDDTKVEDPWYSEDELSGATTITVKKVSGRMDLDMNFGTLSMIPSYSSRKGSGEELQFEANDTYHNKQTMKTTEKGLELRMTSSSDFLFKWIAGATYYKASDYQGSLEYLDGEWDGGYRFVWMDETLKAVFANITYPVTDVLRATFGYRRSWDDIVNTNDETRGHPIEYVTEVFDDNYSAPDYKFGVEYDLGANSMLYADYSTSYRVQGMGGGPGSNLLDRPPEKLNAYSIGAKNRFLGNKLQVNASAYYYDYKNFFAGDMHNDWNSLDDPAVHTPMSDEFGNDPNASTWGDGHMMGADIQTSAIITGQDMLNLSVSYLDSEWTDLVFEYYYPYQADGDVPRGEPGSDPTAVEVIANPDVSYNGKPMTLSPKFTITGSYSHNFNLWNGGSIKAQIDGRYKTSYRVSWKDAESTYNYQEAHYIINLSSTYAPSDGKWTLSGYVKNLQNYAEKNGVNTSDYTVRVGNPRTYGAVLSVKF